MEQVWLWLSTKIGSKYFNNIEELEAYVYNLFDKLPKNVVLEFIQILKDKLKWVLESGGELFPDHLGEI